LKTPRCAVFYEQNDRPDLDILEAPLIVKPVFEGNSIGIERDSVCPTPEAAEVKALALHSDVRAPVMVEELIEGTEVNVCLLQDGEGEYRISAVALNKRRPVYDYRQKHFRNPFGTYEPYRGPELATSSGCFLNIAKMLGKLEFLRIDCIVRDGQMYCIELSPDADLSFNSALYLSVAHQMSYNAFVRLLIENAIESYRNQ
jgi:D-alanine-D-alanine ligase